MSTGAHGRSAPPCSDIMPPPRTLVASARRLQSAAPSAARFRRDHPGRQGIPAFRVTTCGFTLYGLTLRGPGRRLPTGWSPRLLSGRRDHLGVVRPGAERAIPNWPPKGVRPVRREARRGESTAQAEAAPAARDSSRSAFSPSPSRFEAARSPSLRLRHRQEAGAPRPERGSNGSVVTDATIADIGSTSAEAASNAPNPTVTVGVPDKPQGVGGGQMRKGGSVGTVAIAPPPKARAG